MCPSRCCGRAAGASVRSWLVLAANVADAVERRLARVAPRGRRSSGVCAFVALALERLGFRITIAPCARVPAGASSSARARSSRAAALGRVRGRRLSPLRHAAPGAAAARAARALMAETLSATSAWASRSRSRRPSSSTRSSGASWAPWSACFRASARWPASACLLPATFGLDATRAIVMLAGIYYGAMYGGSTTSILMRIPGEAASVMTCIDGYAMARKGRGGAALAIAAVGSYVAGTVSVIALMLLAPPLAAFALRFGPPEYFALLAARPARPRLHEQRLDAASRSRWPSLGLLLGMIGIDQMTGYFRYAYGVVELGDGIGVVPVAVGLFGLAEILATAGLATPPTVLKPQLRELLPTRQEWRESAWPIGRGTVLGFLIGIVPGSAHIISSFVVVRGRAEAVEAARGVRPGRGGGRGGAGVGEQRGDLRRLRADAGARRAVGADPRGDAGGDDGARGVAGPAADQAAARALLGIHRLDVRRQRRAADPEPAARRPLREHPASAVSVPLPGHPRLLDPRRLRGQRQRRGRVDHADHGALGYLSASSTSRPRRSCWAWCWRR